MDDKVSVGKLNNVRVRRTQDFADCLSGIFRFGRRQTVGNGNAHPIKRNARRGGQEPSSNGGVRDCLCYEKRRVEQS